MREKKKKIIRSGIFGHRIFKSALILLCIMLFVCIVTMIQIQHVSIWSESVIKPLYQYDKVYMHQGGWWGGPAKALNQGDLLRLYFVLGSTRKYQPEKYQKYLPEGEVFNDPVIVFECDEQDSNDASCLMTWEYKNNTIIVEENEDGKRKTHRYYIDKKNAQILHDIFEKYI